MKLEDNKVDSTKAGVSSLQKVQKGTIATINQDRVQGTELKRQNYMYPSLGINSCPYIYGLGKEPKTEA